MALAGFGLAGCETSAVRCSARAARPRRSLASPRRRQPQTPLAKVSVAPIIGAPDAIGKQIQQEFTERDRAAARHRRRPARTSAPTTRCAATSSRPRTRTAPRCPTSGTSPIPSGKRVNRITGEEVVSGRDASKDPWAAMTPQVAQSIAGKAANSLRRLAAEPERPGAVAAAQPSSVGAQPAGAVRARQARSAAPARRQAAASARAAAPAPARPRAASAAKAR